MSDTEYFELKYLEEIHELFLHLKEITRYNNLQLLHGRKDNSMDLFDFISKSIKIVEEEDEEEISNTFNEEEYYSMLK